MAELQELRRYRRDLHRIPELDFDLPQTIAYIEGVLAPLTCDVTHPCPGCVCAFFDAGVGAAHATAIRADMDALPIAEATGQRSLRPIPARCMLAGTMDTWPWRFRRQPLSTVRSVSSRAPLSAMCSLCFSRPRRRLVVPRRCARAACSSATGWIASSASTCGPICPPARWRAAPVRCWRVRVRHTFISMARASISLRPMAFRSRSRTMRRWRLPSSWFPSASSWTSWVSTSPALVSSACCRPVPSAMRWRGGPCCRQPTCVYGRHVRPRARGRAPRAGRCLRRNGLHI